MAMAVNGKQLTVGWVGAVEKCVCRLPKGGDAKMHKLKDEERASTSVDVMCCDVMVYVASVYAEVWW